MLRFQPRLMEGGAAIGVLDGFGHDLAHYSAVLEENNLADLLLSSVGCERIEALVRVIVFLEDHPHAKHCDLLWSDGGGTAGGWKNGKHGSRDPPAGTHANDLSVIYAAVATLCGRQRDWGVQDGRY
jgi:hypothetical protein